MTQPRNSPNIVVLTTDQDLLIDSLLGNADALKLRRLKREETLRDIFDRALAVVETHGRTLKVAGLGGGSIHKTMATDRLPTDDPDHVLQLTAEGTFSKKPLEGGRIGFHAISGVLNGPEVDITLLTLLGIHYNDVSNVSVADSYNPHEWQLGDNDFEDLAGVVTGIEDYFDGQPK